MTNLAEHEQCVAVTRNTAGDIIRCITCDSARDSLSLYAWLQETPAWNKLDNALVPTDADDAPYEQGDVLEDAVRPDNDGAINDAEREHTRPPLPWRTNFKEYLSMGGPAAPLIKQENEDE